MGWLERLFRSRKNEDGSTRPTIPTVKGNPRLRLQPPPAPKISERGTAKYQAEIAAYRAHIAHNAAISRTDAVALGITSYKWLGIPGMGCDIADRYSGKVFRYDRPPPEGHVGEGECGTDWCRCVAAAIVPGFEV
jgi:hypothetical protein